MSWVEKWLLVAVVTQILMSTLFVLYGSQPARSLVVEQRINRTMLCDLIFVSDPLEHEKFVDLNYCLART